MRLSREAVLAVLAIAVATAVAIVVIVVAFGGGGGDDGGGDGELSGEVLAQQVFEAMNQPGMVYHAVGSDTETWLDIDAKEYRERQVTADGDKLAVGSVWMKWQYDPSTNQTASSDESLVSTDRRPRIDDPAINWLEALGALAFAQELVVLGERTSAEGDAVMVLEARSPIVENGVATDRTLIGRLELVPDTLLLSAFERQERLPLSSTPVPEDPLNPTGRRIVYTVSELIPRSDLDADFFSSQVVDDAVLTFDDKVQQARDLGIEPYWLGEDYADDAGTLKLQPNEAGFVVDVPVPGSDDSIPPEVQFHYVTPTVDPQGEQVFIGEALVIKLWPADKAQFAPPVIEGYSADLPENRQDITVNGVEATVLTSLLRIQDLPCPEQEGLVCPESDAPLYRRLVIVIGDTAIQIEAQAKIDDKGVDRNPYNSDEAIMAVAEALMSP